MPSNHPCGERLLRLTSRPLPGRAVCGDWPWEAAQAAQMDLLRF